MKILNVNFSIDPLSGGGTAERTYQLSRFLANKKDVKCSILTMNESIVSDDILRNLENVNVTLLPCLLKRYHVPYASFKKLKSIVNDADIIHLIGHWTILNALVYWWAKRLNKPYVFSPAGALPIFGRSKIIKRIYNWFVGKNLVKHASAYIAISESEIPEFQAYGIHRNEITLVPNGVCGTDFTIESTSYNSSKLKLPLGRYILFVGRLNYIKGPDLLLQAFSNVVNELDDVHLVFAGPDDGMLKSLKALTDSLKLQNQVHFIGRVGGEEKTQAYKNADLLVIPSRKEAMSIVVLEGGILGKPVLMTTECGFSEITTVNGGLEVSASVEGLENGLRKLFLNTHNLPEMGMNLKNYISNTYTWDCQADKLQQLYQQVVLKKQLK